MWGNMHVHAEASSWLWYCALRYPFLPLGIFFIFFSFLSIMADIGMAPLAIIWNYSKKAAPGNEIRLHLFTVDQGGEGVEHKTEGFTAVPLGLRRAHSCWFGFLSHSWSLAIANPRMVIIMIIVVVVIVIMLEP